MTKQSIAVVALFLASSNAARMERKAPKSINLFATGMNGDEDLGQDIIMKGDKFHYQQSLGEMTISESATPVKPVAAQAPVAAKPVVAAAPVKVVAPVQAAAPVKAAPVAVAAPLKAKAVVKAKGKGKDDGDDDAEEEKDGADVKKPGEATWEEHNDCKENESEFGDGNCAFEAENLKIGRNDLVQVGGPSGIAKDDATPFSVKFPVKFDGKGYPSTEKVHTLSPEVHMEYSNQSSTYLYPRTAFYVDIGEGEGIWMAGDPEPRQAESVRGPSNGAPIGSTVHALSNEAGEPYAAVHGIAEPERHIQHQPVIFDRAPEVVPDKKDVNKGFTASESIEAKTIATGPFRKEDKALAQVDPLSTANCNGSCPSQDHNANNAVNTAGIGGGLHGLVNDVETYAWNHHVGAPARHAGHQPIIYDSPLDQGATETAKGKNFETVQKNLTKTATAPADGAAAAAPADGAAAPVAPADGAAAPVAPAPAAPKAALAQIKGDDIDAPPKGYSKIPAIRPPQAGAPIGVTVYNISTEGTGPYATVHNTEQPARHELHQPVLYNEDEQAAANAKIPVSVNPGITASQSADPVKSKTIATGAIVPSKEDIAAAKAEATKPIEQVARPPKVDALISLEYDTPNQQRINKKDIGDKNIDEEVWGFVNADKNTLPWQGRRNENAYPVNGWANPAGRFAQEPNTKKDIGDKNIDEEVWGFVNADKNTLPWQGRRNENAYPVNGWANPAGRFAQEPNTKKDIGDKNIDEEVWGFVNADKNTLPWQGRRNENAYPVNGWANPAGRFAQEPNTKKDIGDKNIDEEVWGFVNADKNTLPWQGRRNENAYPVNGWANPAGRFVQKNDISDKNIDEEVWGFVNADKNTLPWQHRRNENAYPANGWLNPAGRFTAPGSLYQVPRPVAQKAKDIANKEVRPDVWTFVNKNVNPTANWRSEKPPSLGNFEAYKGAAPVPEFAHPSWKEPAPEPADEGALQTEFLGNPEKVNVMDPIAYQTRANKNTLDGGIQVRRTSFYNKKAGVWMGDTDML